MITVWFTHAKTGNEKGFKSYVKVEEMRQSIVNCLSTGTPLSLQRDDEIIIVPVELLRECFVTIEAD